MKIDQIISRYSGEIKQGLVANAANGRPLSMSTVRTRLSDLSIIAGAVGDADTSDPALGGRLRQGLRGRSESTIAKSASLLKIAIRRYDQDYRNRSLRFLPDEKPVLSLTRSQVRFVVDNYHEMHSKARTKGRRSAVDYAVIGLIFGARVGDMRSWSAENLIRRDSDVWLSYTQQKTGTKIELPCPELAEGIFLRNASLHGLLMPRVSNRLNESLRSAFSEYNELSDIADRVHIHTMRSSCATYLLSTGVPEMYVKSVTGHRQDSRAFRRYVAVHNDLKLEYKNLISK